MESSLNTIFILASLLLIAITGLSLYFFFRKKKPLQLYDLKDAKYFSSDDYNICYKEAGHGPHLVLLHGTGASQYIWRYVVPQLKKNFHVITLDLPGFGSSTVNPKASFSPEDQCRRIIQVLDHLNIDFCHLCGSSMGGTLSLWLMHLYPKRFGKSVLLAPAVYPCTLPLPVNTLSWAYPIIGLGVNRRLIKRILRRILSDPSMVTDDMVENYYRPYHNKKALIPFLKSTYILLDRRMPEIFQSLTQELLLVWGESDKMVSEKSLERLSQHLEQLTFIKHPKGGHHIMEDHSVFIVENINEFLSKP